jgi:hypothetical protein
MPSTTQDSPLRYVDAAYRHQPKYVTSRPRLDVPEVRLKWYNLAPSAEPVPEDIERKARRFLAAKADSKTLGLDGELGFVVLHRCGEAFYFLLVNTWRGSNELWETVFHKQDAAMQDFASYPFDGAHRGTFCVWELGAVLHEKDAWVRFLTSERTAQDQRLYLEATFAGAV